MEKKKIYEIELNIYYRRHRPYQNDEKFKK